MVLVGGLLVWSRRFAATRDELLRINRWAMVFIVAQALGGGFVVLSRLSLASTLLHAALMALLFAALADGARRTLRQRRVTAESPAAAPMGMPAPAR
jgi:heme A synthase